MLAIALLATLGNMQLYASRNLDFSTNLEEVALMEPVKQQSNRFFSYALEIASRESIFYYTDATTVDLGPVLGAGYDATFFAGPVLIKARGFAQKSWINYITNHAGTFPFVAQSIFEASIFPGLRFVLPNGGDVQIYAGLDMTKMIQDTQEVYSDEEIGGLYKCQDRMFATVGARLHAYPFFKNSSRHTVGATVELSKLLSGKMEIIGIESHYNSGLRCQLAAQVNRKLASGSLFFKPFFRCESLGKSSGGNTKPGLAIPYDRKEENLQLFSGVELGVAF